MSATFMGGKVRMFNANSPFKKRLVRRPPPVPPSFDDMLDDMADNVYEINPPQSIKLGLLLDEYTGEVVGDFHLPLPSPANEPAIAIIGASGTGKCLGKGTKIVMFDGTLKKVEDIKVGDLLMGIDSTPRKVLSTTSGIDKMYKIKQSNGIDYIVNEPHILSLIDDEVDDECLMTLHTVKDIVENPELLEVLYGWRLKEVKSKLYLNNVIKSKLKIEYIGEDEYFGFELDGDRLFLLEDFTVTHNTITVTRLIDEIRRTQNRGILIFDSKNQYTSMNLPNQDINHVHILEENGEKPDGVKSLKVYIPQNMIKKFGSNICKERFEYTDTWKIKTNDIDASGALMLGQKAISDRDYVMSLSGIIDDLREAEREQNIPITLDSLMDTIQNEIERMPAKKRSLDPLLAMFDNLTKAGMIGDDGNDALELLHKPYVRTIKKADGSYEYKSSNRYGDVSVFNSCGSPKNISVRGLITNMVNALSNKLIYCFDKKTGLPEYRPIVVFEEASMLYGKKSDPNMVEAIGEMMDVFGRSTGITRILIYQFEQQAISGLFESDNMNIKINMMSTTNLRDERTGEFTGRQISKKGLAKIEIRNMNFMPDSEFLVQILPPKCNVQS